MYKVSGSTSNDVIDKNDNRETQKKKKKKAEMNLCIR